MITFDNFVVSLVCVEFGLLFGTQAQEKDLGVVE